MCLTSITEARHWHRIRESVDAARDMVSKGQGDLVNTPFNDINQGKRIAVFATPKLFLSYFDRWVMRR